MGGDNRGALRKALINAAESGKLDLVELGGRLRRIEMTMKDQQQNRCMNGEVIRREHDREYCGKYSDTPE